MLPTLEAPELVFGLCSPIGTKNSEFTRILRNALLQYDYSLEVFKVTELMKGINLKNIELKAKPIEARYDTHIKYANKIRELTGMNGALAILCCAALRAFRRKASAGDIEPEYMPRKAYVFDQFKTDDEITVLRQVYGRSFIQISLNSDPEFRAKLLTRRIAEDHAVSKPTTEYEALAKDLIRRDEDEDGLPFGQKLRATFPLADLFLNLDNESQSTEMLRRFLELLFGSNKHSPFKDEYGMYIAKSAALRSLDLSRQVGAAIFSQKGEVISLGCNEVPKAGGGTYWSDDVEDKRDYRLGSDENERMKKNLLADIVRRFHNIELFREKIDVEDLIRFVLAEAERKGSSIREAQLMDLLEFGRIIHAEMSAISDAARLGREVRDATLFCTTFPCHMCAKHIVAAGIKRVVYIEPFPKSYAGQLHSDSINITSLAAQDTRVVFSPFVGVSPFRFRELFERGKRKGLDGNYSEWRDGRPRPMLNYTVATYLANEVAITKILELKIAELVQKGEIMV